MRYSGRGKGRLVRPLYFIMSGEMGQRVKSPKHRVKGDVLSTNRQDRPSRKAKE